MAAHVIIDLPGMYKGDTPSRKCCVCYLPESLVREIPNCRGRAIFSVHSHDQKTSRRRYKRVGKR